MQMGLIFLVIIKINNKKYHSTHLFMTSYFI